MDILTLATIALTLATPFITKIGEGVARKIGEDIWNLIKKPFQNKGKEIDNLNSEELKQELINLLIADEEFRKELEGFVLNSQNQINNVSQNIYNSGAVEKQINIGTNIGNITM